MIRDWMKALLAILSGNVIYFLALPILPTLSNKPTNSTPT
jgi:hypothetical protein